MDVTPLDRSAILASPTGWQIAVKAALLDNFDRPLILITMPTRTVRRGWTITLGGETFTIETVKRDLNATRLRCYAVREAA